MAHLRRNLRAIGLSERAATLVSARGAPSTRRHYDAAWHRWGCWCDSRNIDPVRGDASTVVNFLTELFDDGAAFRTLALYRSAIASLHAYVGDIPVSLTQVVTDFFRAIRAERPPRPRYERLWHLEPVLRLLESWGPNADMPLPRLTKKLTFSLACANQNRASDSAAIAVSSVVIDRHGARFTVVAPKERSSRRYDRSDMVERIEDPARCVVRCMETYLSRTTGFRVGVPDRLLLTTVPPIHAATPQTIAKWNLACMAAAGIDTMEFKSHSIRAVATTTAVAAGAPA
jgi:site-specific recombinase XerD